VNTFGLGHLGSSEHIHALGGDNNDSTKLKPIPPGYSMVRFINGNSWLGLQLNVDLDTESVTNPISTSAFDQPMPDYVRIPAGKHTLLLSNHVDQQAIEQVAPIVSVFEPGLFYTVRYLGDASNPPLLIVDPE
jgi:hypothetical protein